MTVERIPGDDAGIYKFDRVKVSGNKDIAEYLKAYGAANDPGNRLDRLEAGARAILKAHGFDEWPIIEYQEPIEYQGKTITGGRKGPPGPNRSAACMFDTRNVPSAFTRTVCPLTVTIQRPSGRGGAACSDPVAACKANSISAVIA